MKHSANYIFVLMLLSLLGGTLTGCPGADSATQAGSSTSAGSSSQEQLFAVSLLGDLKQGDPEEKQAGNIPLWLEGRKDERFASYPHVLDKRCSKDKCITTHDAAQKQYVCPCCASRFDHDGAVVSGAAPRPLRRVYYTIRDGQILVDPSREL